MEAVLGYLSDHAGLAYAAVFLGTFWRRSPSSALSSRAARWSSSAECSSVPESIDAWLCAGIAVLGAVLGDALSYELGRRYRERIYAAWPVSRFPGSLRRGVAFVQRHGAWNVLLGRFARPVRAIVAVIAGIAVMSRPRFYA